MDFYLLKSLFEDVGQTGMVFFNTRIVRVTEVLLYCRRLYTNLGVQGTAAVRIAVTHGGLRGRRLGAAGHDRDLFDEPRTAEDRVTSEIRPTLARIEPDIVDLAKEIVRPLFMVFDFFELTDPVYTDIVHHFVHGRVT